MASEPRRRLLSGADATVLLALVAKFSHFMLHDELPLRLVVDLEGIALTPELKDLVGKIDANDPYIARVRIGQYQPSVVRLVIELKGEVAPQVYQLDPVGPYPPWSSCAPQI